jgi:gliding motility-associated-like protein
MIWKGVIALLIVFWFGYNASAQVGSRLGRFEVNESKGCVPFTVTITVLAPFVCDAGNSCDMDFEGDGNFQSLTFTHTYNQPGTYLLRILMGTSGFDDVPIEVTPNTPPQFDVYACGNNEVSVKLNDSNYDEYVINYNDGSPEVTLSGSASDTHAYAASTPQTVSVRGRNFNADDNCNSASRNITPMLVLPVPTITLLEVLDASTIRLVTDGQPNIQYRLDIATNNGSTFQQVKTLYNKAVDTVFNLRTDDNYYCFRLTAVDPCNNLTYSSPIICSANFDLTARNNAMDLLWATNTLGTSSFRLNRSGSDGSTLQTTPPGSPYSDPDIACGIEYCYQLTTNYPNGSQSISLEKCAMGLSTDIPTRINDITALVGDDNVVLEWQTDVRFTAAEYRIEKSNHGNYSFLSAITTQSFVDPEYRIEDESCYRLMYEDVCGNESPVSIESCPIRLTGNLLSDNTTDLRWSPYIGWTNGVAGYRVEKYTQDGQLLRTFEVGQVTSYVDDSDDLDYQTFVYLVRATPVDGGLRRALSNPVEVLKDPNLFYPTAFTPNGDNLNDNFTVFGQYVTNFEMKIFNRWGELLFVTNEIESGWDGNFRGAPMPEGTYTFIAHIQDRTGRTFKRSGSVLLLRKR